MPNKSGRQPPIQLTRVIQGFLWYYGRFFGFIVMVMMVNVPKQWMTRSYPVLEDQHLHPEHLGSVHIYIYIYRVSKSY